MSNGKHPMSLRMEMAPLPPEESRPVESFSTIYKSETDTSFSIPIALIFELDKMQRKELKVALYDLRRSLFKITIFYYSGGDFTELSSYVDENHGGDAFDKAIVEWLFHSFNNENSGIELNRDFVVLQRLYEAAEQAKIELDTSESAVINLPYITSVGFVPKHLVTTLDRKTFERLCDSLFQHSIDVCERALADAHLSPAEVDAVFLLGRSTNTPRIQELVTDFFGKEPDKSLLLYNSTIIRVSLNKGQSLHHHNVTSTPDIGSLTISGEQNYITDSIRQKKKDRTSKCSQKKKDAIIARVWPKLAPWVRDKKYHSGDRTYKALANETGIKKEDLQDYFKYVEPIGLHSWMDRLRIEDAQSHMAFFTDEHFTYLPFILGFNRPRAFQEAFERFVEESPTVWRIEKAKKIQSGDDPLSPMFKQALSKVDSAFTNWIAEKHHHIPGISLYHLAPELNVSETELYLYCDWVLKKRIWEKINDIRIEEAKQILLNDPSLDISDVANEVGYMTSNAFVRHFRGRTGNTPSAWRKKEIPNYVRIIPRSTPQKTATYSFDDEEVKKWIRKKGYCKPNISLNSVAHECGFTDYRFSQYLQQVEHTTFNGWISKLRIAEAERILINNAYTEQVGHQLGFTTKGSFLTWFKQQTGSSPDEWRSSAISRRNDVTDLDVKTAISVPSNVKSLIDKWVEGKGYCSRRLSLKTVAMSLGITDDQLANYCSSEGFVQFRSWISFLRIKEAQRLLITYPSMQVMDIARKVGISDVKAFRETFKRLIGASPTVWRENNDCHSIAEVLANIRNKPAISFSLDRDKIKDVESTTNQAQGILSNIFVEDEPIVRNDVNQKAEETVQILITLVLEKDKWAKTDFEQLCKFYSIMPGYAIERINDITFEKIGDVLIDEDKDVLYINTYYKESLI